MQRYGFYLLFTFSHIVQRRLYREAQLMAAPEPVLLVDKIALHCCGLLFWTACCCFSSVFIVFLARRPDLCMLYRSLHLLMDLFWVLSELWVMYVTTPSLLECQITRVRWWKIFLPVFFVSNISRKYAILFFWGGGGFFGRESSNSLASAEHSRLKLDFDMIYLYLTL